MKLAWATDVHLNFLSDEAVDAFACSVAAAGPDAVLLTGDIAEAPTVEGYLRVLEQRLRRPIYFVLGNHDFYRGSVASVRRRMAELTRSSEWLRWMPAAGIVELTPDTGLVGHDGWGDGRLGSGIASPVMLNDFVFIEELAWLDPPERFRRLALLGDEAAAHFRNVLPEALDRFPHVLALTHVPPFREACLYEGRVSADDFLPHFACRAVGEALHEAMLARPDRDLTVLCGHTHSDGVVEVLPNLRVRVGAARYGSPALQPEVAVA
jgi:3',5'-cyclic AMP phosphodiesterase CpdA